MMRTSSSLEPSNQQGKASLSVPRSRELLRYCLANTEAYPFRGWRLLKAVVSVSINTIFGGVAWPIPLHQLQLAGAMGC